MLREFTLAGRLVLVEVPRFDAGGKEHMALQVERLAAIVLGNAHVADQHGLLRKRANVTRSAGRCAASWAVIYPVIYSALRKPRHHQLA